MKQVLEIKKNCDNCIKEDACKFLSQYRKLVRSNEFFEMFEHLEWNNLERVFKDNAPAYKCYFAKFKSGELVDDLPREVWEFIYRKHLKGKWKSWSTSQEGVITVVDAEGNPVTKENLRDLYEISIVNKLAVS